MTKSAYLYRMAEGWLLGLLILLASSCQEDSIPTYSGGARIQWLTKFVDDSLRVDFSFTQLTDGATQAVVELPFKVIGPTADHDRAFSLRQVDDEGDNAAVEGVDFTLPEQLYVEKGKLDGFVPVTLMRTPALDQETRRLALEFVTDGEFGPGARLQQRAIIEFSNQLAKPPDDFFYVTDSTLQRVYLDMLKKALDLFNNDPDNIASGKAPVLSDPDDPTSAPISFVSQSI